MSDDRPKWLNRRVKFFVIPLMLIVATFVGISSLPSAHAAGFPGGPGLVCITDPSAAGTPLANPCSSAPYVFDGPFPSSPQSSPTQLRVGVFVNGSAGLNGYDITLLSNSTALQPAGIDLTGTILVTTAGSPTVVLECIGGVVVTGQVCSSTDNSNTLHVVVAAAPGGFVSGPATGLLFTAIYNIAADTPPSGVPITFQTGCGTQTSISGGVCVTVPNGTLTPDSETAQTATFNNSACATTCTIPWVAISSSVSSITVPQGASTGNQITVSATAENGFPGFGSVDSVAFTSSQTSGFAAPSFSASSCVTGGTSCSVTATIADTTSGTYTLTIFGTYVAGDTAPVSTPTDTLVGSVTVQVNVQAVGWSINGVSSSTPQTVYMAQGASNPLTLLLKVQSLGGYSGTVTFATNSLSDGGTGLSFNYPASFVLGSGQTITQTVTITATSYGTTPALYQAQLVTSSPTLVNQTSAALTIHVTGFSLVASASSITFNAGSSTSFTITASSLPNGTLGFAGKVTISKTVTGGALTVNCPSSLTLTAGGTSTGICSVSGTAAGSFTISVKGTGGTNSAITNSTSVSVTVNPSGPASFNITPSPASVTGVVGSSPFTKITLKAKNGFSGTVILSETSSPAGLSCGFSATGIPLTTSATAILSCTSVTPTNYTVTVTGTKGTITNSTSVTFAFTDFSIFASPTMASTTPGVSVTATITVGPINGFAGNVTLSTTISPSTGLACSLSSTGITGGSGTSVLSCTGAGGTYAAAVLGTSPGLAHITMVVVNVADFTIVASPSSLTLAQGPPGGTATITINAVGGFSGTVTFTGTAPSGFSAIFNPASITISGTSTVTIGVSPPAVPGTYSVNVTGTSGTITHTTTITVTVTSQVTAQPPFLSQMTWNHRFSLSKYGNIMTWKFGVQNNSTSTLYFSVTITGVQVSGTGSFIQTTTVFSEAAGKNTSGLTLTQTFSQSEIGETFVFSAIIHWGTAATTDPSQLPFTSTATNGVPTSGSFTVLA